MVDGVLDLFGAAGQVAKKVRKRGSRERVCLDCGKVDRVRVDNAGQRCTGCSGAINSAKGTKPTRKRVTVTCAGCGATIEACPSRDRKFCSVPCKDSARSVERRCLECGRDFRVPKSRIEGATNASGNFCCRPCYDNWLCRTDSESTRGSRWHIHRKEALRRAPFCAICGRVKRLQVHHIVPWRLSKDNSQDNLIPLCPKHHKMIEVQFCTTERLLGDDYATIKLVLRSQLLERQSATRIVLREVIDGVVARSRAREAAPVD